MLRPAALAAGGRVTTSRTTSAGRRRGGPRPALRAADAAAAVAAAVVVPGHLGDGGSISLRRCGGILSAFTPSIRYSRRQTRRWFPPRLLDAAGRRRR